MRGNYNLFFYLRKQKIYKGGPIAIYMRITISGKRAEMSTGRMEFISMAKGIRR